MTRPVRDPDRPSRRQLLTAALVCLALAALCGWAFVTVNFR